MKHSYYCLIVTLCLSIHTAHGAEPRGMTAEEAAFTAALNQQSTVSCPEVGEISSYHLVLPITTKVQSLTNQRKQTVSGLIIEAYRASQDTISFHVPAVDIQRQSDSNDDRLHKEAVVYSGTTPQSSCMI